jgi:hypothetical protein
LGVDEVRGSGEEQKGREEVMAYKTVTMFLVLALAGSGLSMGTEPPATAGNAEEAVKEVVQEFVKLYNSKDSKAIISLYHPDAKIKTGMGSNQRIVSRKEYADDIVPTRVKQFGTLTLKSIDEVQIKDNKSTVKAIIGFDKTGGKLKMAFSMVLEGGKWLITVQDY